MYYDENNNYFEYNDLDKNHFNVDNSKNYDLYNEIKFNNANFNFNYRANNLYSPSEGLNLGNMFTELYDQYKNYKYKVIVRGKREELLLKIQELTFATKDLNLYLDLHPEDSRLLEIYKSYNNELQKLKDLYNKEFGPLCAHETNKNYFDWINNPWPWENKGGNKNV